MDASVVYLPCEPYVPGDPDVRVALLAPHEDVLVLTAWTSPERLAVALGEQQAWVSVPLSAVADVRDAAGASAVVLDPAPEPAR